MIIDLAWLVIWEFLGWFNAHYQRLIEASDVDECDFNYRTFPWKWKARRKRSTLLIKLETFALAAEVPLGTPAIFSYFLRIFVSKPTDKFNIRYKTESILNHDIINLSSKKSGWHISRLTALLLNVRYRFFYYFYKCITLYSFAYYFKYITNLVWPVVNLAFNAYKSPLYI